MFFLLLALVVLSPLPLASVYPPAWLTAGLVVGAMLCVWSIQTMAGNRDIFPNRLSRLWLSAILCSIPVIWAFLQTVPGVPPLLAHPVWGIASGPLDEPLTPYISVHPDASVHALIKLVTYIGVFWLSFQYCRDTRRARLALTTLSIAALVYSTYGIIAYVSGTETILWYEKSSYFPDLTSTFVNRNSYATYAGLGLLAAIALLMQHFDDALRRAESRAEKIYALIMSLKPRSALAAIAVATSLVALVLSHSRAGFASGAIATLALLLIPALRGKMRRSQLTALLTAVAIGVVGLLLSTTGQQLATRLATTDLVKEERTLVYERVLEGIEDHAWVGVGYGAFPHAWRLYRDEQIKGNYEMAHSVYLELAIGLGVIPAVALVLSVAVLWVLMVKGVRQRRRDFIYPGLGVAATVLVAVHSAVDFSLQIPAVAINYAFMLGLGCAHAWRSS
jgi:O-antigen ligase